MHWLFDPNLSQASSELTADEAKHARSLRLRVGEKIRITNGFGLVAKATMVSENGYQISEIENYSRPRLNFHLIQALAKADRDELAMQTSVELGAASITPWSADRSVVRWDGKETRNRQRWQQIAIEAMKQSQQPWLSHINPLVTSKNLEGFGKTLVLDPVAADSLGDHLIAEGDITLVVGPEGGISDAEFSLFEQRGFQRVRLGSSVLRTSSAGPAAIAALQFATGGWN